MTTFDPTDDWAEQLFGPRTRPRPAYDAASYEDGDTLRRSFGGLSKYARDVARRPPSLRTDEYGYDRQGRWYADRDGVA